MGRGAPRHPLPTPLSFDAICVSISVPPSGHSSLKILLPHVTALHAMGLKPLDFRLSTLRPLVSLECQGENRPQHQAKFDINLALTRTQLSTIHLLYFYKLHKEQYYGSLIFQRQLVFHFIFFSCVLYYIKLHYITLSYYLVHGSLLSLLQLFFCSHVRLLYVIKYYLLTYLQWQPWEAESEHYLGQSTHNEPAYSCISRQFKFVRIPRVLPYISTITTKRHPEHQIMLCRQKHATTSEKQTLQMYWITHATLQM